MCIYIYIYVCVYVYMYTCICIYITRFVGKFLVCCTILVRLHLSEPHGQYQKRRDLRGRCMIDLFAYTFCIYMHINTYTHMSIYLYIYRSITLSINRSKFLVC